MQIVWDERHGKILVEFLKALDDNKIKYFILRGYKDLPNRNLSKDVDIMIDIGTRAAAEAILKEVFVQHGIAYFYPVVYGHAHCYLGMNTSDQLSIHIDLIEGYVSKGFEVITFEELYQHVVQYNDMNVLDDLMNGIMLVVYKIFGYHHAKLKLSYQADIFKAQQQSPKEFRSILVRIAGEELGSKICNLIAQKNFDAVVALEPEFTKALKKYTFKTRPLNTIRYSIEFVWQKVNRIIFNYKKHAKTFAVIAPDGTGKTTFLNMLIKELSFYYVNYEDEGRFHVYHFRPEILPNLGAVGEKAGVMKQDTDFTKPHRSKPANPLSSLLRISYYTVDYIIGWQKCVRNDVHYDRYTIFDRYCYDFIIDPKRTKLNLPEGVRKFFVSVTPQPKVVFFLDAEPDTIYTRKQELPLNEIKRQVNEYRKLAKTNPSKFKIISAEQSPKQMAGDAVKILLDTYTERL